MNASDVSNDAKCWREFRVGAPAGEYNPFDTREIRLECEAVAPSGATTRWLGFAFQEHRPVTPVPEASEADPWEPAGNPDFRVRFLPRETGEHTLRLRFAGKAVDDTGESAEITFDVDRLTDMPLVRMAPHGYAFELEDGRPFYPIGSNLCWADRREKTDSQLELLFGMMHELAENGGTAFRLWCNAQWQQVIDWTGNEEPVALQFGQLSMAGCAKIDAILARAEELGLRIMFCIDAANNWGRGLDRTPYGTMNGGPCSTPRDYFESPLARAMTREKMRYVASRWAHSPAVWCWEFWNEVDGIGLANVHPHQQLAWHEEMIRVLRAADPVGRIVTTSTGHPLNFGAVWRIPEIEFTQTHHYGYQDSVDQTALVLKGYHESAVDLFGKGHLSGEIGTSFRGGPKGGQSPWETDGRTLHTSLWGSAILPKACAPALFWWWQKYIHEAGNAYRYRGIAAFLAEERWNETLSEPVELRLIDAPARHAESPETLKVPTTMSGNDYYTSVFVLDNEGRLRDSHLIANTWYGPDTPHLHFRQTFLVDFPEPGEFALMVWGGNAVCNDIASETVSAGDPVARILLDGECVLERKVCTGRPEGDDYCDRLTVAVPAGPHEIEVCNAGGGIFLTGHILLTNYRTAEPRLHAQGLRCGDRYCFWFLNLEYAWPAFRAGVEAEPVTGASVEILGVAPGRYEWQWWDTVKGAVAARHIVTAPPSGVLRMAIPDVRTDLAAKLIRL